MALHCLLFTRGCKHTCAQKHSLEELIITTGFDQNQTDSGVYMGAAAAARPMRPQKHEPLEVRWMALKAVHTIRTDARRNSASAM